VKKTTEKNELSTIIGGKSKIKKGLNNTKTGRLKAETLEPG
jgi:hypothetical protein